MLILIEIDAEHVSGKFVSRETLLDAIIDQIDETLEVDDSEYTLSGSAHECPKPAKRGGK